MDKQLPLPAAWARGFGMISNRDPAEQLEEIKRDKLDAKHEIWLALDRLAEKHGVPAREVNEAVWGYVDNMLDDVMYEVVSELEDEIDKT